MIELTVLLISIIIILLILSYTSHRYKEEQFQNFYLSSCPSGYKSFYDNNGDINCCDGEVIGKTNKRCLSNNQCTLNGRGDTSCTKLLGNIYKNKATNNCPRSMPNYYENTTDKGCISGELNETMSGPQTASQPKCIIYDTLIKNKNSIDSFYNQKLLESAKCFGTPRNNCTKRLEKIIESAPPVVAIRFIDGTDVPRTAYSRDSYKNYLYTTDPGWEAKGIDLEKNIIVAEVAEAFYIDKTIQQEYIQF
jgi:hypothetical protein